MKKFTKVLFTAAAVSLLCFAGCKNLLTFVVPSSVTNLGMKCFENCYNLQNITLSPLVKNIEYKIETSDNLNI